MLMDYHGAAFLLVHKKFTKKFFFVTTLLLVLSYGKIC